MEFKLSHNILTLCLALAAQCVCAAPGTQIIDVTLSTFATKISPHSPRAGNVKFVVKNIAADKTHEFILVKTELSQDNLPMEENGTIDEDSPQLQKITAAENLRPGESREFSVTLAPGHYVYFCNIHAHHMVGMRGEFTIDPIPPRSK